MQSKENQGKRYYIPVDGEFVEVTEEVYRAYYSQFGTPDITRRKTASAAAPRPSSGNVMASALAVRTMLPERKSPSTLPSAVRTMI